MYLFSYIYDNHPDKSIESVRNIEQLVGALLHNTKNLFFHMPPHITMKTVQQALAPV